MARNFMYVHERIYKEQNAMQTEFKKLSINGRRTSQAALKRIKNIISNATYRVAQECQVLVAFPRWHIEGKEVVLGKPSIMLPDCRLVTIEQLKDIEFGRRK